MPHSSGGGSHSSGGHSGGFHSSGGHSGGSYSSGGSSAPIISNHYFSGCRTFVYYERQKPNYLYSNYNGDSKPNKKFTLFTLIGLIVVMLACSIGIMLICRPPKKILNTEQYETVIEDNANCLGDTQQLEQMLLQFKEKTGITVAIVSVYNEDWKPFYSSLENYAYNLYVNKFTDETHWLVVYSTPQVVNPIFEDWYWEGMQGNDTDEILSSSKTGAFNESLQKYLTSRAIYTISEAFNKSFEELNGYVMNVDLSSSSQSESDDFNKKDAVIILSIFTVISIIFIFVEIYSYRKYCKYDTAIEVKNAPNGKPETTSCAYCGGVYVNAIHANCPHCGAAIIGPKN